MNTAKKHSIICYGITICILVIIALWGMLGPSIGFEEINYNFWSFFLIMPLTSITVGLIMGIEGLYLKWLYPVFTGILNFTSQYFLYEGSGRVTLFLAFIPALLGVSIGTLNRTVTSRIGHKEESMNTAKKHSVICYGITICIFVILTLRGASITGWNSLGFGVLSFYFIMPLTSITGGLIMGIRDLPLQWPYPVFTGILYSTSLYFLYGEWSGVVLLFSFIPALLGVSIGTLIRTVKSRIGHKEDQ
ncbi:MAG: hypothetical protein LBU58_06560 [Clostridiales bacterium]|jgi:hypothetical protein|nr:hypothetical protein [Clostridiales bacterium]